MPHITSLPLDNKLLCELEGRIELFEISELYPGGIGSCLIGPSD
jgi:hypothetical protein